MRLDIFILGARSRVVKRWRENRRERVTGIGTSGLVRGIVGDIEAIRVWDSNCVNEMFPHSDPEIRAEGARRTRRRCGECGRGCVRAW